MDLGIKEAIYPGDFVEDFPHENGMYQHICLNCKEKFIGHKRRLTCKTCELTHRPSVTFSVPEMYRMTDGFMGSDESYGCNGVFIIPVEYNEPGIKYYQVIASDGMGWRHVSVTMLNEQKEPANTMPSWEDMCYLKDLFWDKEACVVQFHPPHSEYVNNVQYCLHLWEPTYMKLPMPDSIMVGIKGVQL